MGKTIMEEIDRLAPPEAEVEKQKIKELIEEYNSEMEEKFSRPFTKEELERTLKNYRDKSLPGLDQVEYRMIKNLRF